MFANIFTHCFFFQVYVPPVNARMSPGTTIKLNIYLPEWMQILNTIYVAKGYGQLYVVQ
jgi:hypothetical protein